VQWETRGRSTCPYWLSGLEATTTCLWAGAERSRVLIPRDDVYSRRSIENLATAMGLDSSMLWVNPASGSWSVLGMQGQNGEGETKAFDNQRPLEGGRRLVVDH